jgi:ATP-binding cassette subfamily C protein
LRIEGLTLRTPDGSCTLVDNLTLSVRPGHVIGIRGPNGVGKSSVLRAILGLMPTEAGAVWLNGENTRAPREGDGRAALGAQIGYLPQGAQLLEGSVLDNIRRFSDAPTKLAVDAARQVGAHAAIGRFPQGYDTRTGTASGLSGGQQQMIALARAFFGSPALLALDEPEAGLDANLAADLRRAVSQASGRGSVTLLVTHESDGWQGIVSGWLNLAAGGTWTFEACEQERAK